MRPYRKKRELANWIRRKLGQPVIDVLIDSSQLEQCIDQATDYFGEHAGGIGNEDSILLICPELVYYDGTGNPDQPGPTAGKWRKPFSSFTTGTTGTTGTSACPTENCSATNTSHIKPPLDECINSMPSQVNGVECQEESTCEGPGWCGDNAQDPHCFTETEKNDPNAEGPYWVEGDTTVKPTNNKFLFKSVYDVPKDIIACHSHLGVGYYGTQAYNSGGEALFSPLHLLLHGGGNWGMQSPTGWVDNRYGYWHGSNGGFVDVVGWEMGMQYLEMFRQLYTTKIQIQLMDLQHKVRITPAPSQKGVIAFGVTRRVPDESLYEHQWVRDYATALAMYQIGINSSKYQNLTFPGGGSINGDFYLNEGKEQMQKLIDDIDRGRYREPIDFYMG